MHIYFKERIIPVIPIGGLPPSTSQRTLFPQTAFLLCGPAAANMLFPELVQGGTPLLRDGPHPFSGIHMDLHQDKPNRLIDIQISSAFERLDLA